MLKVILSYIQFQLGKLRPCLRVGVCVGGGEEGAVSGGKEEKDQRRKDEISTSYDSHGGAC